MHVIQYRPLSAPKETRVEGSIWSPGPTAGTHWVIPLDNGPRRTILVCKEARTQVWVEATPK